eukprot:scaffold288115_cov22-Prasinocladus_malaysianus.AAC.1
MTRTASYPVRAVRSYGGGQHQTPLNGQQRDGNAAVGSLDMASITDQQHNLKKHICRKTVEPKA